MKKPRILVSFDNLEVLNLDQWTNLVRVVEQFETYLKDCLPNNPPDIEMSYFNVDGSL